MSMEYVELNPSNLETESLFCIKDIKSKGFKAKADWLTKRFDEGLRIIISKSADGKPNGFIEFVPIEKAWRPVKGTNLMFIHCLYVYPNKEKNKGLGSELVSFVEEQARKSGMDGVAVMTSKGTWLADKKLFVKNGFQLTEKRGRMELMVKLFNSTTPPVLLPWDQNSDRYSGWHLLYANQCPWHKKVVDVLTVVAKEAGIKLQVTVIETPEDAQQAPSGFGVFSLVKDGKLLEDHYISETRFRNILRKEMAK